LPPCLKAATTKKDVDIILKLAMTTDKPVLIGLDGQVSIVKVYTEGDENQSFEALYDTVLTEHDLKKIQRSGAASPDEIPLEKFRIELVVNIDCILDIPLMVAAFNQGDANRRLRSLLNGSDDPMFHETLHGAIVAALRKQDFEYAAIGSSAGSSTAIIGKPVIVAALLASSVSAGSNRAACGCPPCRGRARRFSLSGFSSGLSVVRGRRDCRSSKTTKGAEWAPRLVQSVSTGAAVSIRWRA